MKLGWNGMEPPVETAKLDAKVALQPLFMQYKRPYVIAGLAALLADLVKEATE